MKFEELNQEEKERKMEALRERVEEAMAAAPDENEFKEIIDRQDAANAKFRRKEISYEELGRELNELDEPAGAIETKELTGLMDILRIIGLDEDQVKEVVAHENDHCAKALSLGLDAFYQIQFLKTEGEGGETNLGILPSTRFKLPKDVPDDEKIKILKEVVGAVEKPSPHDENQLR